jgi:hypothetical protein
VAREAISVKPCSRAFRGQLLAFFVWRSTVRPARRVVTRSPHRSVGLVAAPWLQPQAIEHESELEKRFLDIAVVCPSVFCIHSQPFVLADIAGGNYTPDYLVRLRGGVELVVEVKPERFVERDRERFNAATAKLAERRIDFYVLNEHVLDERRSSQGRLWRRYAMAALDERMHAALSGLAAQPDGVSMADAVAAGIAMAVIYRALARRELLSVDALKLSTQSRLITPQSLEPCNERLYFDRWVGCTSWRPDMET